MKHVSWENKENCSGCKACAAVCPTAAISYCLDEEGFSYPNVNKEACIGCGKCVRLCPQIRDLSEKTYPVRERVGAKHAKPDVRMRSRSGGVFTAISDEILEMGGCVYGAVQTSPYTVEHLRAQTKEERDRMCGSKYVQSDTEKVYEALARDVESGRPVLFSGTPCQCAAVYALFGEKENLYLCDCLCHGVPPLKVWKDYLDWTGKTRRGEIEAADFRDKQEHTWESHVEKVVVGGKTVYSRRFANLFGRNAILRPSCYACRYTTPNRISDFTIADYWGIEQVAPEFDDGKGISLVMVRTEKGCALFGKAKQALAVIDTMAHEPTHYNLKRPTKRPENRDAFWRDYEKHGFAYVSSKYGGYDILRRIKNKLVEHID